MTMLDQATRPSPFAVFRNPSFTRLWSAQFISQLGSGLTTIAAGLLVYQLTGSALSVGLMMVATTLPSLLLGLLAGVVVDRCDRRAIMIAADLLRAVCVALIPVLAPANIIWLYLLVTLSSTATQFFDPANESLVPELASDEELAAANALMNVSVTGAQTLGFAAAGLIAARWSIAWAFYLDAFTFVLSALCIARMRVSSTGSAKTSIAVVLEQLRDGLSIVRHTTALRSLFQLFVPIFLVYGFTNALLLPFALRTLHAGTFAYGLLEGVPVLGLVLGSLVMGYLANRLHEGQWIAISAVGQAAMFFVIATLTSVPAAIAVSTVAHLFNAPSAIARRLMIQRNTPREARGRVNSAFFVMRDIAFVLGMSAVGLADLLDVRLLYASASLVLLTAGVWALVLPGLRRPRAEWRRTFAAIRTVS